jgi:hypothetical protein
MVGPAHTEIVPIKEVKIRTLGRMANLSKPT